jgi:glycosyltransferase involved in cell wall biosynthesis
MKILVFAHSFEIGGTQVNAIELAAALRDAHGHEIVVFATPGPMVAAVEAKGLRFVPAPRASTHPSFARMLALRDLIRTECPDLIQVWDWPQCLDAFFDAHLLLRIPVVVTDQSMGVSRILPKTLPTTFGTPELVDRARALGRSQLEMIPPPVNIHSNAPGAVNPAEFRERFAVQPGQITLITVSRLTRWMKAESITRTIDVIGKIASNVPVRFVVVGDGDARERLQRQAHDVNSAVGREAVLLTGPMVDPRPAYAAADIVIGMGASALRGMAFMKPVVIVGERGFCAPFDPSTADAFYYKGIYGLGDGDPGNRRLFEIINDLVHNPERFDTLGRFSREFVVQHFAVETIAARLDAFMRQTISRPGKFHAAAVDGARTAAVLFGQLLVRRPSTTEDRDVAVIAPR